jgi:hypothetical protein
MITKDLGFLLNIPQYPGYLVTEFHIACYDLACAKGSGYDARLFRFPLLLHSHLSLVPSLRLYTLITDFIGAAWAPLASPVLIRRHCWHPKRTIFESLRRAFISSNDKQLGKMAVKTLM